MELLTRLNVGQFGDELASASPAPGGGSAAALAGSLAASLVAMVCHLSLGREEVQASDEEISAALDKAERLRGRLLELVDEDTAAFNAIMDAIRMPKGDEAERASRKAALAKAKLGAAVPPLQTLAAARETLELGASLVGRTNKGAASDLGVAAHLGRAAAEGALLNVAINLASLPDGEEVERFRQQSQTDIAAARDHAASTAAAIGSSLGTE